MKKHRPPAFGPNQEKFGSERVERMFQGLREEETYAASETCEACTKARGESGDETALCEEHLAKVLGL